MASSTATASSGAGPEGRRPDRVLIVLHQEHSSPGRIGQMLIARGFRLDIRRPRFGDPLPDTMADHAGAIVFGGPMSANDPDDYVRREIDWIRVPLVEGAPFLGICLGAQMLVRHLGGSVAPHPEGQVEIGYYPIEPTVEGETLLAWPSHVYQWHREGFDLPAGVELMARGGAAFPHQAIRCGSAWGVQFHPELTYALVNRWTTLGAKRLDLPGARPRATHFSDRFAHDIRVRAWLEAFFDLWIGTVETPALRAPATMSTARAG